MTPELAERFQPFEPKPFPECMNGEEHRAYYRLKGIHKRLFDAQAGMCAGCGSAMVDDVTVDHVYPTSLGGTDDIRNKVAMHSRCNGMKGNRLPNGCDLIWHDATNAGIGVYYEDLSITGVGALEAPSALALALMSAIGIDT